MPKVEYDTLLATSILFETMITGFEDVFNNPEDTDIPPVTARDWSLILLNAIKDAKEQRNLPMPNNEDEINKMLDIITLAITNLQVLGFNKSDTLRGVLNRLKGINVDTNK